MLAVGPLIVMREYDFEQFWGWLEQKVTSCEADTWPECVEKLRRAFAWEYDGMTALGT